MQKIQLFEDIYAYEFDALPPYKTYVYCICRRNIVYIIDTFCGSYYMQLIKNDFPNRYFMVINTHYHFDHIWGNASFQNSPIYAHVLCKTKILQHGKSDLLKYSEFAKDVHSLKLPTHTFTDHCDLENGIQLHYTPGHTMDSISIYDQKHQIYFTGDNLEKPLIQIEENSLQCYQTTLQHYIQSSHTQFFAGHTLYIEQSDIQQMLQYLMDLQSEKELQFHDAHTQHIHDQNLQALKNM